MLDNSELKQLAALLGEALSPRIREAVAENVNVRLAAQRQAMADEHALAMKELRDAMSAQFVETLAAVKSSMIEAIGSNEERLDLELAKTREQVESIGIENNARFKTLGVDFVSLRETFESTGATLAAKIDQDISAVKASIPVIQPLEPVLAPEPPPMLVDGELTAEMREVMDVVVKQIFTPMLQSSITPVNEAIEVVKAEAIQRDSANFTQVGEAIAVHVRNVEEVRNQIDATLEFRGVVGQIGKRVEDVEKAIADTKLTIENHKKSLVAVEEAAREVRLKHTEIVDKAVKHVDEAIANVGSKSTAALKSTSGTFAAQLKAHMFSVKALFEEMHASTGVRFDEFKARFEDVETKVGTLNFRIPQEIDTRLDQAKTTLREYVDDTVNDFSKQSRTEIEALSKQVDVHRQAVAETVGSVAVKMEALKSGVVEEFAARLSEIHADAKKYAESLVDLAEKRVELQFTCLAELAETKQRLSAESDETAAKNVKAAIDALQQSLAAQDGVLSERLNAYVESLSKELSTLRQTSTEGVESVSQHAKVSIEALQQSIAEYGRSFNEVLAAHAEELTKLIGERIGVSDLKTSELASNLKAVSEEVQGLGAEFENARLDLTERLEKALKQDDDLAALLSEAGVRQSEAAESLLKTITEVKLQAVEAAKVETEQLLEKVSKNVSDVAEVVSSINAQVDMLGSSVDDFNRTVPEQIASALKQQSVETAQAVDITNANIRAVSDTVDLVSKNVDETSDALASLGNVQKELVSSIENLAASVPKQIEERVETVARATIESRAELLGQLESAISELKTADASTETRFKALVELAGSLEELKSQAATDLKQVRDELQAARIQVETMRDDTAKSIESASKQVTEFALNSVSDVRTALSDQIAQAAATNEVRYEVKFHTIEEVRAEFADLTKDVALHKSESEELHLEVARSLDVKLEAMRVAITSAVEGLAKDADVRAVEETTEASLKAVNDWRSSISESISECRSFQGSIAQSFADVRAIIAKSTEGFAKTSELEGAHAALLETLAALEERMLADNDKLQKRVLEDVQEAVEATKGLATLSHLEAVRTSATEAASDAATAAAERSYDLALPQLEATARGVAATAGAAAAIGALPDALQGHTEAIGASLAPLIEAQATQVAEKAARTAVGPLAAQAAIEAVDSLRTELRLELNPADAAAKAVTEAVPALVRDNLGEQLASIELRLLKELTASMQREVDRIPKPENGKDGRMLRPVAYEIGKRYEYGDWTAHGGGIWVAARSTDEEPTPASAAWDCVAPGIKAVETVLQEDGRTIELHYELADGSLFRSTVKMPIPVERGVYNVDSKYEEFDVVTYDGSQWTALKDGLLPRPGSTEGAASWKLRVKRGKDGKDLKQPPPPIIRYAGQGAHEWEPDVEYPANTVVKHAGVFWLSMRSTHERPPFVLLASNDTWLKMGA